MYDVKLPIMQIKNHGFMIEVWFLIMVEWYNIVWKKIITMWNYLEFTHLRICKRFVYFSLLFKSPVSLFWVPLSKAENTLFPKLFIERHHFELYTSHLYNLITFVTKLPNILIFSHGGITFFRIIRLAASYLHLAI